jgi:hypothetical protein
VVVFAFQASFSMFNSLSICLLNTIESKFNQNLFVFLTNSLKLLELSSAPRARPRQLELKLVWNVPENLKKSRQTASSGDNLHVKTIETTTNK